MKKKSEITFLYKIVNIILIKYKKFNKGSG